LFFLSPIAQNEEFRMNRRCLSVILLAAASLSAVQAEPPIDRGVGQRVSDFTLLDTTGKEVHLYGFAGKKAAVIVFVGTGCPISDLYLPRFAELARKYESAGIPFLAIDSNSGETAAKVAEHAKKLGVSVPVLMDPGNLVADSLQAQRTCEALVLDGEAILRYRGAIDDQYTQKGRKERAGKQYLVDALDAVIAGRTVPVATTPVSGCPIERALSTAKPANRPRVRASTPPLPSSEPALEPGPVNYASDVATIIQRKCQECHRPGQVAPFALESYEQARKHAKAIREVVAERRMPPWHADPRYGHFSNDRSLTAKERAVVLAWIDQGMPAGDAKDLPAPRQFAEGWTIGKPDVVFKMPEQFSVDAGGVLPYQYFRVPTGFKEDKWIQAAEAKPGDRSVVHHILVLVDDHGANRRPGEADEYLVAYAPGDVPAVFPNGTAKLIPAGADLVFQVHYTPIGVAKVDCSSVGLIFAKGTVKQKAMTIGISQHQFTIPPGNDNYAVASTLTFPRGAEILSFLPHMHLRGKSFEYTAHYPDGKSEVLLSVPAYDFGWQSNYRLAEPRRVPKGTRIDCLAHFDNSAKNPSNPDPTKTVRWGDQTFEEMMIGYVDCVLDAPAEPVKRSGTGPVARPVGTWKSAPGQPRAQVTITETGLELTVSLSQDRLAFEADCTTSDEGHLYGRIRKVVQGDGPVPDDVFGFRYDLSGDALTISGWKGSGVMAQGVILEGKYSKAANKTTKK
jgi:peroxiredoxin